MRFRELNACKTKLFCFIAVIGSIVSSGAVTVEELRAVPDLTPAKFASYFKDFEFKFRGAVQSPEVFLASESGDCDDYSTLAAEILRERGYTPRLITIRMPRVTHVVCYIEETESFLDYNTRSKVRRTVASGPSLEEIATKVARSYRTKWTSVSEFTFEDGAKRLVKTVVEQGDRQMAGLFK